MELPGENTLVVKHLPHDLSADDRVDLLKHLGAVEVSSVISDQKKTSLTFARFRTPDEALNVIKQLHQQRIRGRRVSVEFAKDKALGNAKRAAESELKFKTEDDDTTARRKIVDTYLRKLHSWTSALDFTQPPPVHLRYHYPPPTSAVLKNICRVMARSTKFYTQVLHLMNKMNLPCPFSERFDVESDLVGAEFDELVKAETDEDSEIETDKEEPVMAPEIPKKVTKRLKFKFHKLQQRKEGTGEKHQLKPEEVFETTRVQALPKKIELKVSTDLSTLTASQEAGEVTESIDVIGKKIVARADDRTEEKTGDVEEDQPLSGFISLEELESNRIPSRDFHLLPVFKNYQPGPPSCRLYIKNLAKTVQLTDLEFIFNRYRVEEKSEQVHLFDIRLMQEGRMKGQAFVTLQDVSLAQSALKEVNGYILKGKAMVVQFARSAKPK